VGTYIRVAIKTMKGMDTERCTGLMAAATKVNGKMVSKMESEKWNFRMGESKRATSKTTSIENP